MYQYFGIDKQIHACVFEVTDGDDKDQVSVYYSCEDLEHYVDSGYIYKGDVLSWSRYKFLFEKSI